MLNTQNKTGHKNSKQEINYDEYPNKTGHKNSKQEINYDEFA